MITNIPLPKYSRPAFASRGTLDRLLKVARHEVNMPFEYFEAVEWVYALRLAQFYIKNMIKSGRTVSKDFVYVLKHLHVFMPPDFVQQWEKDCVWKDLNIDPSCLMYYEKILESNKPSDLYIAHTQYQEEIWGQWVANTNPNIICSILGYSENVWRGWAESLTDSDTGYYKITQQLGPLMGLGGKQTHIWGMWEEWITQPKPYLEQLVKLMGSEARVWFPALAETFDCSTHMISDLFGLNGILVKNKLYKELHLYKGAPYMPWDYNSPSFQDCITDLWKTVRVKDPVKDTLNWDYIVEPFDELKGDQQNWPSLSQYNPQWLDSFQLPMPASFFVVGSPGSGKHTLVRQLLQESGKTGYVLKKASKESLDIAQWILKDKNAVLIVKNTSVLNEEYFKEFLSKTTLSVIALLPASSVSSLNTNVLQRFHHVVDLDELPYTTRLKLAEHYFSDKTLALKIARSLKFPSEIARCAAVCQQTANYSWEQAQKVIKTFSKIQPMSVDYITVLDENDEHLPQLGQSKVWENMFVSLGTAFENPQKCKQLGGNPPKGAVLWGPPGTGKTLFARHLAKKLSATCLSVDCAKVKTHIKEMFDVVRSYAPCIVLLDEATELLGYPAVKEYTLALTSQLDGVENLEGVMFIATTNKHPLYLHAPLLRSGRLSEIHHIDVPQTPERARIWEVYLKDKQLDRPLEEVVTLLNRVSRGFVGADIKETVRKVVEKMMLKGSEIFDTKDLLRACDDLMWAAPNGRDTVCPEERWATALHEAGHALLAWHGGFEVSRVTIRSRGGAAGSVQFDAPENHYRQSKKHLAQKVQMFLGGIAAEQAVLQSYGQGGSSDLAGVRQLLQDAFAHNGLGYAGACAVPNGLGQEGVWTEMVREEVEMECRHWANELFQQSVLWLQKNEELLKDMATTLMNEYDLCLDDLGVFEQRVKALPPEDVCIPKWVGSPSSGYVPPVKTASILSDPLLTTLHQTKKEV